MLVWTVLYPRGGAEAMFNDGVLPVELELRIDESTGLAKQHMTTHGLLKLCFESGDVQSVRVNQVLFTDTPGAPTYVTAAELVGAEEDNVWKVRAATETKRGKKRDMADIDLLSWRLPAASQKQPMEDATDVDEENGEAEAADAAAAAADAARALDELEMEHLQAEALAGRDAVHSDDSDESESEAGPKPKVPAPVGKPPPKPAPPPEEPPPPDVASRKGAHGTDREETMRRLAGYVRAVQREPAFAEATPFNQVDEALRRVKSAGLCFWGKTGLYTRRRTVLDSFLQLDYIPLEFAPAAASSGGPPSSER